MKLLGVLFTIFLFTGCDFIRTKFATFFMSKKELNQSLASCIAICLAGDENNPKLAGNLSEKPIAFCSFKTATTESLCQAEKISSNGKSCSATDDQGQVNSGKLGQIVWAEDTKRPRDAKGDVMDVQDCTKVLVK